MENKWKARSGKRGDREERGLGQKNTIKHIAVTQFNETVGSRDPCPARPLGY